MNRSTTFWVSVFGWLYGVGLFMIIRFLGTGQAGQMRVAYSPSQWLLIWAVAGIVMGVFYYFVQRVEEAGTLRKRSYGFFLAFQAISISVLVVVALLATEIVDFFLGNTPANAIMDQTFSRLTETLTIGVWAFIITWSAVLTFFRQMMIKVGPQILGKLILGRYHHPREEDRIFLFLDLKASTTLADRLGHAKYSRLIQDCFYDITDSVLKHEVEIYQYIGDEVVMTWKPEKGVRQSNCIRVYYDFWNTLQRRADYYMGQYGVVPFFKAGLNVGPVTVTEIGVVKRDIAYLSEVLHTAARIQGKCNELGKAILISDRVKALLASDSDLQFESLGHLDLRGKEKAVGLFAVTVEGVEIPYPEQI